MLFPFSPPDHPRLRAVITGVGVVSPMGMGWRASADGFRTGRVALGGITLFDTSRQRTSQGGQVALPDDLPEALQLSRSLHRRLDRSSRMLLHAASEAIASSGWDRSARRAVPLVFGTSAGAMELGEAYFRQASAAPRDRRGQPTRVLRYQPQMQPATLQAAFGLEGAVTVITNACASGANAVGHALRLIRSGRARRVLCGGYDALSHLVFAGFDSLQALSTTSPRPFDATRDGLALGEGAAVFTVEELGDARARDARILAEIAGYGAATDIHHLTQPDPAGSAAVVTMRAACAEAGVRPAEIDYINSHGTGTPLNDAAEGAAIQAWAGDDCGSVSVSSTKGSIGHLLGGAGAVETAICLMAIEGGWVPPNVPVVEPDPVCRFDLVTAPRTKALRAVLTNSFGFGGANASLVLRAPDAVDAGEEGRP